MSALGHKQTFGSFIAMSAIPQKRTFGSAISTSALCQYRTLPYSITPSARVSIVGGILRFRALAVLRLITRSNLVGCSTGRSVGVAPVAHATPARRVDENVVRGDGPKVLTQTDGCGSEDELTGLPSSRLADTATVRRGRSAAVRKAGKVCKPRREQRRRSGP
jgi:hypothetical protein